MSKPEFDVIAAAIESNLDYLHKQRWDARAAELHGQEEGASAADRERVREALREHYENRYKPETSREALMEQARINFVERQSA